MIRNLAVSHAAKAASVSPVAAVVTAVIVAAVIVIILKVIARILTPKKKPRPSFTSAPPRRGR